jgi:hypothetical protein
MRRLARQREAVVALGLLLSVLGSLGAGAAETRLIAKCRPPEVATGGAPSPPTLSCEVRANGFAAFTGVTASLKTGEALDASFKPFDSGVEGATTAYLIQLLPNNRRATLSQMGDAVVTFTDQREGKRRFTAYTFANDVSLVSDSGASKNEFVRQMIAVKPASGTIQLYKSVLRVLDDLKQEPGDRKNLVILADGTSDDTGYSHDQVVKAAREAGIPIHVLGYYDDRAERPKFQTLSRLAEETGGYAAEIRQGPGKDLTNEIVTSRFAPEVLENGGVVTAALKGPPGPQIVEIAASLAEGAALRAEEKVDIPAPPQALFAVPPDQTSGTAPDETSEGIVDWLADNAALVGVVVVLLGLGAAGYTIYRPGVVEYAAAQVLSEGRVLDSGNTRPPDPEPVSEGQLLRAADGTPAIYGWLEALDGEGARHPLRTTNVRVGRHKDNDICLMNDSISRRHAVLHYNADTRRFVITDLGGGNGVIVNKTKYKSRELNDGDTVELGEVRLRFRAETEHLA